MSALVSLRAAAGDRDEETQRLGQKGAWLRWLAAQGERVPEGFVIPVDIALRLRDREPSCVTELQTALDALAGKGRALAVRASPVYSLPGALLTELDLAFDSDPAALCATVLGAIDRVLQSAYATAVAEQLAARAIDPGPAAWLAIVVQVMVHVTDANDFGAVALTHDPARGELGLLGEYAPGQATAVVVSGRSRPQPLARTGTRPGREDACLEVAQPQAFARIRELCTRLTVLAGEPLELELVITQGEPWVVQARPLVLSARATLRVALDAVRDGSASASRLLRRLSPKDLVPFVEARLPEPSSDLTIVARGLAASPGVATGRLTFGLEQAIARAAQEPVVLVRRDALPEDIAAFRAACAVVTTSGGLTSHAAVIARGLRVPAVIGCAEVRLDAKSGHLSRTSGTGAGEVVAREGDLVTVDGHRGIVYAGSVPPLMVVAPELQALCIALRARRRIALLVIGPSSAADRAYQDCALDGIWDPLSETHVRGSATSGAIQIVNDLPTDSLQIGQLRAAAIACLPEHAPSWALWLGCADSP